MTRSPCRAAVWLIATMSGICPYRWTAMTARVAGVRTASIASGVISRVASSTSANRGRAPARTIASTVATNVLAGTTTSSPGPIPTARRARWRASVPLATPTAYRVPQNSAHSSSNCVTRSPPTNCCDLVSCSQPASTSSRTSSDMPPRSRNGSCLMSVSVISVPPTVVVALSLLRTPSSSPDSPGAGCWPLPPWTHGAAHGPRRSGPPGSRASRSARTRGPRRPPVRSRRW